jgi:single-stranded-DNA-specific exonuclease
MTLKPENYERFKAAFEKVVQQTIAPEMLTPEITVDAEIDFNEITLKLVRILKQFEPFGPQNRTPVFLTKTIFDTGFGKKIGADETHLKLYVKQKQSESFSAIGFNLGSKIEITDNKKPFQAVYCIEENEWNGKVSIQLRLKDLRE